MTRNRSTIIAVGAHHDDNELIAGTLARHVKSGWRVISVVMTDGRFIRDQADDKHIAIRETESQSAAAFLGIETRFLRFREGNLQPDRDAVAALVQVFREFEPNIVVTHPLREYHLDHMNTSRAVFEAVFRCGNPCFEGNLPACTRPTLYYSDAWFVPFEPDEYVDITEYMDLKLEMLRCHKSQLPTDGSKHFDILEMAQVQSRHRGIEAGVSYAEAFRLAPQLGNVRLTDQLKHG